MPLVTPRRRGHAVFSSGATRAGGSADGHTPNRHVRTGLNEPNGGIASGTLEQAGFPGWLYRSAGLRGLWPAAQDVGDRQLDAN